MARLEKHQTHMRQLDLISIEQLADRKVFQIGAGGIGSSSALYAAKLGIPEIHVWDDDKLEIHNLSNQMLPVNLPDFSSYGYDPISAINHPKVELLHNLIEEMTDDVDFRAYPERWTMEDSGLMMKDIVVAAVDSMAVRKEIFEACLMNSKVKWFIDGRMSAETGRVYVIDMANEKSVKLWEDSWRPDSDYPEAPCTSKSTIYCSGFIGSIIASQVKKIVAGQPVKPLFMFDLANMIFMAP